MPFVNEVVSDDDIDRYNLPFAKGGGQWWTRDQERDLYLWGGESDNPARDEDIVGRFNFYIHGIHLKITLELGEWSKDWDAKPYVVAWNRLISVYPQDFGGLSKEMVIGLLKEALVSYGRDGWENRGVPERVITFKF